LNLQNAHLKLYNVKTFSKQFQTCPDQSGYTEGYLRCIIYKPVTRLPPKR